MFVCAAFINETLEIWSKVLMNELPWHIVAWCFIFFWVCRAASTDDIDSGYGRESTPVKSPTVDQEDQDDVNKDESLNLLDEDR